MFTRSFSLVLLALLPLLTHGGGVYWTDRGASQLKRMNFDGSNLQTITLTGAVTSPGSNIRGLAVDNVSNQLFWADNGADRLLRANLDGSSTTILYSITNGNPFPADVRLDLANQHFYWCDQSLSHPARVHQRRIRDRRHHECRAVGALLHGRGCAGRKDLLG